MPSSASCSATWPRWSASTPPWPRRSNRSTSPRKRPRKEDATHRRLFVLQMIQPGLAGLMDGSVSTLAPVFAAAFATRNSRDALLVGLAASRGRRHLHGVRRSALRRRLADRPRPSVDARLGVRAHDHRRRHRPHAAVPDPRFPRRDHRAPWSWSRSNWPPSARSATATWTRRSSPPRSRWWWAACWCS